MKQNQYSWPELLLNTSDENGKRIYKKDWSEHAMGPIEDWSPSFITILSTAMGSRFPALMLWGTDFISFFNEGYGTVLGDKQIWALGRPLQEIWPEAWESLHGMLKGVIETGNGSWAEDQMYFLDRNGFPEESYFTFSFARIIDEKGGFGGILCTAIETTEKVIAERRLKTLREIGNRAGAKSTVDAVYLESLEVLKQNPKDIPCGALITLSPDKEILTVYDFFGMDFPKISNNLSDNPILKSVLENGVPEIKKLLPEGMNYISSETDREPIKLWCILPLKTSNNNLSGFLLMGLSPYLPFNDSYKSFLDLLQGQISAPIASAKIQQEGRDKANSLAELDRLKNNFFSNVSHEFRTPLTLLLGPLEDALGKNEEEVVSFDRETFESLYRNALRLLKLVNSLLDFSRMQAGRVEAYFEPIDLAMFTTELTSQFRSLMEKVDLNFKVEIDIISEHIFVDRTLWEKIVLNLLSNAFKFTFEGSVEVYLKELSNEIILIIKDSGIGIPKDELPKIFNRFYRVEGAKSRNFEGSGIGLALVHDMVELHSGNISVESTENKGSIFRITMPKGYAHLPPENLKVGASYLSGPTKVNAFVEEASRWIPKVTKDSLNPSLKSTILIVDDNADMRDYLKRILLAHNYNVLNASNGIEALQIIQTSAPNLIISDIMMPEMNGFELLKQIKLQTKNFPLPVILLSAQAGKEATIEGLEAGADDYLVKPFSSKELIARVKTQLAMVSLKSDLDLANQNLLRSNTNLAQYAHVAAHDLQEPLRKIQTFINLIYANTSNVLSHTSKHDFLKIQDAAKRMQTLLSDILEFSNITKSERKFVEVDLQILLNEIKEDLKESLAIKNGIINIEANCIIGIIPFQFYQLIQNLISNSIKFSKAYVSPIINITAVIEKNNIKNITLLPGITYCHINYTDNGIGFPSQFSETIFDSFKKLHGRSEYEGTGLGLSIVKNVIDNHNGFIRASSKLNEGATFDIYIPVKQ